MMTETITELDSLMAKRQGSVDPSAHADEVFELFSIPAYDSGKPETMAGADIGSSKIPVQPGDVLLSRIVPHIRRSWIVPQANGHRQIASGEWIVFRGEQFEPSYLRHLLMSDRFHAQFMNTVAGVGGSLLRARPAFVAKIEIPLPPVSEQRRIADILDKADAIRRKRREAVGQYSIALASTFAAKFGPGGSRCQQSRLDDHIAFMTSGSRGWARYYSNTGSRFLRSLDVQMNRIGDDDVAYVNPPRGTEAERTRVQDGDVLVTITGSRIGRVAFVPPQFGEAYISQHVTLVRLKPTLRPRFCSLYLSLQDGGQRQIARDQYGQTKPGLSLTNVREFIIPTPSLEEQDEFLSILDKIADLRSESDRALDVSNQLFASLAQRAFRGEL